MDPVWLLIALIFGLGAQQLKLPPLVGFLLAGFFLNALGEQGGQFLEIASHIGVLLLLFTIGLKLRLTSFLSPAVWGGATSHMLLGCLLSVGVLGVLVVSQIVVFDWPMALLVAFAFSFSSTVLAVKIFEERGEMRARHALVAIGILIIQDLVAVIFLLAADDAPPSIWAFALLGLPLIRPFLLRLMLHAGHGEMLVLFGLTAALAGAELFDVVGMKDDLGALVFGVLLSNHPKSMELTRSLLGFKDFFLIGFFLSIGLIGFPDLGDLAIVLYLVAVLLPVKMGLYFILLTRFRLRARSAFLAMLGLATFSEFGLIVAYEGAAVGWLPERWLVIIAIAVAISFVFASILNANAHELYERLEEFLCRFETKKRLPDDQPADVGDAEVLVVGMGRVGRGAYRAMAETYGSHVCGVDVDSSNVARLKQQNYNVIVGDAEDIDFWRNVSSDHLRLVMLALPTHEDMLLAVKWLKMVGYHGRIGAITKYNEQRDELEAAGVHAAFNYYTEAGTGFADHVQRELPESG
jgi:glutathione-regulated potassium-efflux system ancillary protein KefC